MGVLELLRLPPTSAVTGLVRELTLALESCPAWVALTEHRAALSSVGLDELKQARSAYWHRTSDSAVDAAAGRRLLRRFNYRWHVLNSLREGLSPEARDYWERFEAMDALLEDLWRVLGHLCLFDAATPVSELTTIRAAPSSDVREVCLKASPFGFRLGSVVAVVAGVSPVSFCGVVRRQTISFGPPMTVCLEVRTFSDGWECLLS
jgi:hypothetical protein